MYRAEGKLNTGVSNYHVVYAIAAKTREEATLMLEQWHGEDEEFIIESLDLIPDIVEIEEEDSYEL